MEFEFIITAEGNSTETNIKNKLKELGLDVIGVERHVEYSDIRDDENISSSNETLFNLQQFVESDVLSEKDKQDLLAHYSRDELMSISSLEHIVLSVSSDMDKADTEGMLRRLYKFIKSTY